VIRPRVVVAGNLSLDDTVNPSGSVDAAPGGDALYAALAVRGWGADAVLLTLVGDDYPDAHLDEMKSAGLDVSHIRAVAGSTVQYRVTNAPDGQRRYEWISTPDRLLATSPGAEDYRVLASADWLHVAAMPIEAQETAVAASRAAGVGVSLDPHEEYVVGHEDRLASMVAGSAFMPSELEARLLLPDLAERRPGGVEFAEAASARLAEWDPSLVAIKLGAAGSLVRVGGISWHVPALPVPVVDPTGAGDAFCGGFIVGWLATHDPRIAAACGTVSAAETIAAFGAFPNQPVAAATRLERLESVLRRTAADEADASALLGAAEPIRWLVQSAVRVPA
jgi:ribokinase